MNKNIKLQKRDTVYYKTKDGDDRTVFIDLSSGQSIKEYERDNNCIVTKLERPQTLYEHKEILDEKEKKYLSAVIRPFKGKVDYIKKFDITGKEFIYIHLKNNEDIDFPYFKKGTMYKGMKLDKRYTLKELGLD